MRELQTSTCPDENQLLLWVQGLHSPQERNQLEQHIDQCEECRRVAAQLIRVTAAPDAKSIQPSVTLIRVPAGPEPNGTDSPAPGQLLARGTNLGRYVILDCLGSGGTAVVYGAYDPELERKVAIKLLRKDLPGLGSPEANRSQLLHEAQAMARLSHPNVIVVYDVGTFGDQVFLAMEFVRGKNLRGWLEERPRLWRDILQIFLQAGEGLWAAHQSGLVHRDFKPDNVLVDSEDRARVTDFGLAHAFRPTQVEGVLTVSSESPGGLGKHALVGTPAYIAPEQWKGQPADQFSDQFSFCAALYEALYRERPYPGKTSATLGLVPDPIAQNAVPSWVRRVLLRGLSPRPEARYHSIQELLQALADGLSVRRVRMTLAGSVLALLAMFLLGNWGLAASTTQKLKLDLAHAADQFRGKAAEQQWLIDLRAQATLKKEYLLEALGKADDRDAILGLAPESHEEELKFVHELITSADLPFLKSADALVLVDASGRVLFNRAAESQWGKKIYGVHCLEVALAGQPLEELWSPEQVRAFPVPLSSRTPANDLLLVFVRPVVRGRSPLGAALWGQWIRSSFLPELEQVVGDRLVLRAPDGGGVATLPGALDAEPPSKSPSPHSVRIGPARYLAQPVEMGGISGQPIGQATLLRNLDQELEPELSRYRRGSVAVLSGVGAMMAVGYAVWRARRRRLVR
jgi:predicted Ser/Thr protein kinase